MSIRVEQFEGKNGPVKNQFRITAPKGTVFQSYGTIIAFRPYDGKVILDENYWDYSTTTGKYRNIFLREDKATTEKKIKDGRYILANLNDDSIDFGF